MAVISKLGGAALGYIAKNSRLCARFFVQLSPRNSNPAQNVRQQSIFRIFKKPTPQQFKVKDRIPEQYELIYRNTMDRYLLWCQVISAMCMGLATGLVVFADVGRFELYTKGYTDEPRPVKNEMYFYLTALVVACVVLQLMVMRMPLRIYNHPTGKSYKFVFYHNLPFLRKTLTCTRADISKLPESGVLPWKDSRYEIERQQQVILIETYFRTPADMNIMLGYYKGE